VWAEEQVRLLEETTGVSLAAKFAAASTACGFGALPGRLPIAKARRGWVNAAALERLAEKVDSLVLTEAGPLNLEPDEYEDEPAVRLDDGVLATSTSVPSAPCSIDGLLLDSSKEMPPGDRTGSMRGTLAGEAVRAIARGWRVSVADLIAAGQFSSEQTPIWMEIGFRRRKRLEERAYAILRRPNQR
jgi:hypothetical protein